MIVRQSLTLVTDYQIIQSKAGPVLLTIDVPISKTDDIKHNIRAKIIFTHTSVRATYGASFLGTLEKRHYAILRLHFNGDMKLRITRETICYSVKDL